jgi:uncharacterized membrane protein
VSARRAFIVGVIAIVFAIAVALVAATGGFRGAPGEVAGFAGAVGAAAFGLLAFSNAWRLRKGELPTPR